ncbi:MAG: oligosaccharide flippase family protein [Turicibacter sp.]|nr:oligosaccharide flippase family protein [Turicibacter sp.]
MKKQNIVQGTFILVFTGLITKILGMINRVIVTRLLGEHGIGIYMLIGPTLMLLTTCASIGLPITIPTLISRANERQKKILSVSLIIAMISSLVVSILLFFIAKPLAIYLLKDERTYLPLISIGPLLFFVSLSTILKAYFQGEQNMIPSGISTLVEQIVRMITSIFFIAWLMPYGVVYGVLGTIWASIAGEFSSILILLFLFFKHIRSNHSGANLKPVHLSPQNFKDVLAISLPATGSRVIGSFSHFLEPIVVVQCLFKLNYSSELSAKLYGAVSGFALPMVLMPSFISNAITQAIVPPISQAYANGRFDRIHSHLDNAFLLSFLPSGIYTVLLMLFPFELMNLLYGSSTGANYLQLMTPFFLLLYFQAPLTSTLQAIDKATLAMNTTLVSSIIKIAMMIVLLQIKDLNIFGLVIAILFNVVFVTAWHYLLVRKNIYYRMKLRSVINAILIIAITFMLGCYLKLAVTFSSNAFLNMMIISTIVGAAYLFLLFVCGLFPTKIANLKQAK